METSKDSFSNVLKKAQDLGYAEPRDPKFDLNGQDALAKIRILSALSFNKKISKNNCLMNGIEKIELGDIEIADKLGIEGSGAYVRVSQIKKQAVAKLIANVDHSQVLDYL